jgi:hypothetical protein
MARGAILTCNKIDRFKSPFAPFFAKGGWGDLGADVEATSLAAIYNGVRHSKLLEQHLAASLSLGSQRFIAAGKPLPQ